MADRQLIDRCLAGDQEAASTFYVEHAGAVVAYMLRSGFAQADAEDLTQETFLRAVRSLDTFDAVRGALGAWIGTIARNVARKHWARRGHADNFDPDLADEMFPAASNPADGPQAREEIDALRACVQQLPPEMRTLVELRYVEGLTTRGIADVVHVPEATVRLRLKEAQEMLRRWLGERGVLDD
jgi:RNA polymerase sigma-70 factor (ECF subfamily)